MHLTLQQLKLFEAVYRNASYTRAAEELHLTQPAISIQVKRLEEQVGLPFFEQIGKKIYPTAEGKAVYQASTDILGRVGELKNTVEGLKGEVKGPLLLAVVSTTQYFMPLLLGRFLQEHPEVEPRLQFTNRARIMERLMNNDDDFVVMGRTPSDERLETYPFLDNILVVVAPPGHPLENKKNIKLETLLNERFLGREEGSGTRLAFNNLLKSKGIKIEPYMELGSSEAIKQGVMAGLGLAVLSLHSLSLERDAGKLAVLDVEDFPLVRRWYAVHLKGKKLSLVARTFLEFILKNSSSVIEGKSESS